MCRISIARRASAPSRVIRCSSCSATLANALYLDQIQETAHNLTQYLARADRPVGDPQIMQPGWMCERVNFSDWESRDNHRRVAVWGRAGVKSRSC